MIAFLKHAVTCYLLWNKRLFRKFGFIVILCLIPLMVVAMSLISTEESGAVTVALASGDDSDPIIRTLYAELRESEGVMHFPICESPEAAEDMVRRGEADAAWIFPEKTTEKLDRFLRVGNESAALVRLVCREDTPLLMMAREKLHAALFRTSAKQIYLNYVNKKVVEDFPEDFSPTEEEIGKYFDLSAVELTLFEFAHADPSQIGDAGHYLMVPLRGLLAVLIVLGGFAVTLYWMEDERRGLFAHIPLRRRAPVSFGYHLTAMSDLGIAVLAAIFLSGCSVGVGREILMMLLFLPAAAFFCIFVRLLCPKEAYLGALIPILLLGMLALSPIFFFAGPKAVKLLLPTFHYLNAVNSDQYLLYLLVYDLVFGSVDALLSYFKAKI